MSKNKPPEVKLALTIVLRGEVAEAFERWRKHNANLSPSNGQLVQSILTMSLVDGVAAAQFIKEQGKASA